MQNQRIYSFDDFQLDSGNRQLLREGKPLPLSAKAFDVLQTLLENNGRLVEKDELFNSVWRDQIVEESNLTVHVSQIRKALGENKNNPRYIETVSGYGYRFVGEVSNLDDEEFVIETETLSRITVEKEELGDAERSEPGTVVTGFLLDSGRNPVATAPGSDSASRRLRVSTSQKVAVVAIAILLMIGGIYWLSNRNQNNGAIAPAVFAGKQTQIKRLTGKGMVNHAVLSPDGKFFAYSLQERDAYRSSLWLGQTSGSSDARLFPAADLSYNPRSFSADGNWLYYTVSEPRGFDNGTLYKMPVLGGVPQKLLSNVNVYVVVSPDEKRIAFVRGYPENKTAALVIADLDGKGEREIALRPAGQAFNAFSLSWSADGTLVAFAAESGKEKSQEIFAANLADGSVKQVTSLEWIGISRIAWLGDGSGLVAVARAKDGFAASQLWQIDYESAKAQKITSDLQHYGSTLNLSADSNALIAVQASRESNIWIAPAENLADARQITFGSSGHEGWFGIDWTPDGKIVFVARVDQSLTLWTMDADGANARQITPAGFLDERPSVTADGKYIVFHSNRSGATEIWRMNLDGTDLRQLTFNGRNTVPHSTPDSKTIVYTHNANGTNSAWSVSIEGGEAKQITNTECFNARVSPDGKFIACGHRSDGKSNLRSCR